MGKEKRLTINSLCTSFSGIEIKIVNKKETTRYRLGKTKKKVVEDVLLSDLIKSISKLTFSKKMKKKGKKMKKKGKKGNKK
jgi:hypothetical protein